MSLRRWVYEHRLGMTKLCAQVCPIGRQYSTRSNEHYDTLYWSNRDINIRLAIRQDEGVSSRFDGSLRVMIFPKADCLTGLTDTHTRSRFASGSYISFLANPMMDLGDTHCRQTARNVFKYHVLWRVGWPSNIGGD